MESDEGVQLMNSLWDNTRFFKAALTDLGFDTGISQTPITPVIIGDEAKAGQFSKELANEGVYATGIVFPTVAKGRARVRTIVSATHTKADLLEAVGVFKRVGEMMGVI